MRIFLQYLTRIASTVGRRNQLIIFIMYSIHAQVFTIARLHTASLFLFPRIWNTLSHTALISWILWHDRAMRLSIHMRSYQWINEWTCGAIDMMRLFAEILYLLHPINIQIGRVLLLLFTNINFIWALSMLTAARWMLNAHPMRLWSNQND